jgi:hypothetical protein
VQIDFLEKDAESGKPIVPRTIGKKKTFESIALIEADGGNSSLNL